MIKKKTQLEELYLLSKKAIQEPKNITQTLQYKLCKAVDKVFFNSHIELEKGSYDLACKKQLLDEYAVNVDKNKQTIILHLNREWTERVIKIYTQLDQPSFKFKIYKPSLSEHKPIEYGQWEIQKKEED